MDQLRKKFAVTLLVIRARDCRSRRGRASGAARGRQGPHAGARQGKAASATLFLAKRRTSGAGSLT